MDKSYGPKTCPTCEFHLTPDAFYKNVKGVGGLSTNCNVSVVSGYEKMSTQAQTWFEMNEYLSRRPIIDLRAVNLEVSEDDGSIV